MNRGRRPVYLDQAATTFPKPRAVQQAVDQAVRRWGANPGHSGHTLAVETARRVYQCREEAAALFGCQPEGIIFTKNCTEAINLAIWGTMRPGGHLIISDLEHNAVARVAQALEDRGIAQYDVARVYPEDDLRTVYSFASLLRPNTQLIACTHGSNVFGYRLPVEQIGALAHGRGIPMLVDAAQTAGLLPLDLSRMAVDYLCVPGHKGLYGPMGTGILAVGPRVRQDQLRPLMQGGTGAASLELTMPQLLPDRLESGTLNTPGILGLREGIRFVRQKGIDNLYRREMELTGWTWQQLRQIPGVRLYGPQPQLGRTLPVLSFTIGELDGSQTADALDQLGIAVRGGFHCAGLAHRKMGTQRTGTARASFGAGNTREDAAALVTAVRQVARQQQKNGGDFPPTNSFSG